MRYWPLTADAVITSPYGPRAGGMHRGVDWGRPGGSAGMPVYAIREGRVLYAGAAQGYGGPDPAGWLVIEAPDGECWEYGHIIREVAAEDTVEAGQRIAHINPDSRTNGGTAPHLHVSFMPHGYDPNNKIDPLPRLEGAQHPGSEDGMAGWRGDPTWLEDVLRDKLGDKLVVHSAWEKYGTGVGPGGQMGDIWGVMMHHTGNRNEKPETIRNGVQQPTGWLPGPLSHCLITPDGKCHLVAIGPCNHAGNGSYPGLGTNNGNVRTIGIECAWPTIRPDGSYDAGERWPDPQIITMRQVAAAIVARLGYGADRVIGHKEYAGASQGKWDPGNLDMGWFRGEVTKDLRGKFDAPEPPPPPPATQPPPALKLPALPFDTERDLLEEILRQQRGPYLKGWEQLDDLTLVDSMALLHRKVDRIAAALDINLGDEE